jgi:hypothetical protein
MTVPAFPTAAGSGRNPEAAFPTRAVEVWNRMSEPPTAAESERNPEAEFPTLVEAEAWNQDTKVRCRLDPKFAPPDRNRAHLVW